MHGITKHDRGIVGYCDVNGNPWHNRIEYKAINGPVSFDDTMTIVDYEVVKLPLAFHIPPELADRFPNHNGFVPQSAPDKEGLCGPLMFALVRADTGNQVYEQSVSQEYTVYQNRTFLEKVQEALLVANPQIVIESAGTLFGGRICFVNLILNKFRVTKDPSEQIVRIMFYNAFGGRSITACMHIIRVVCWNTAMLAEAQGALNETLRKFRHTPGAPDRVAKHVFDLAKLNKIAEDRQEILNHMTDIAMTAKDMENFLGNLIPIDEDAGKATKTGRQNRRDAIEAIFNDTPDLQGQIGRTRYAAYQAVLAYSQHHTIPEGSIEVDEAFAWWDVSTGGVRNDMNQKAYQILILETIPEPKKKATAD